MLWKVGSTPATDPYVVETMVADLQTAANDLANNYHAPLVVLLNANTGNVKTASDPQATVALNQIPTVIGSHRYVSVLLGQDVFDAASRGLFQRGIATQTVAQR